MYFSGFCLENESVLFDKYIIKNDFTVSGFSYGAIKAFKYALDTNNRVDKLQLLSPAFFNDKDKKYKRLQLLFFTKDQKTYCNNFLNNCGFDDDMKKKYFSQGTYEQLDTLLNYNWTEEELDKLIKKNIKLEVYLGANDKIVDAKIALAFFRKFGEVYFIKNKGHIL